MIDFISPHKYKCFLVIICLSLMMTSCTKEDPSRHLNLGNWYLQRGLLDEAIMEYREVSRLYGGEQSTLKRDEFQILGTAHLKLAIAYTKKGWWEYALSEAKRSFDISPNKDCHELIALIEEKLTQDSTS
jgi:tetratricopeptide (TPR) repeat protein|tara:strand:+ start:1040 stop:1429 length:390 start_codon:yes stop_codon:yes gene_type:complete